MKIKPELNKNKQISSEIHSIDIKTGIVTGVILSILAIALIPINIVVDKKSTDIVNSIPNMSFAERMKNSICTAEDLPEMAKAIHGLDGFVDTKSKNIRCYNNNRPPFIECDVANNNKYPVSLLGMSVEVLAYRDIGDYDISDEAEKVIELNSELLFNVDVGTEHKSYGAATVISDNTIYHGYDMCKNIGEAKGLAYEIQLHPEAGGLYKVRLLISYTYDGMDYSYESEPLFFVYLNGYSERTVEVGQKGQPESADATDSIELTTDDGEAQTYTQRREFKTNCTFGVNEWWTFSNIGYGFDYWSDINVRHNGALVMIWKPSDVTNEYREEPGDAFIYEGLENKCVIRLYDEYHEDELIEFDVDTTYEDMLFSDRIRVPAGIYYLEVDNLSGLGFDLYIDYIEEYDSNEVEWNNNVLTATGISVGSVIVGNIGDSTDIDCYSFEIEEDSRVGVSFWHNETFSESLLWQLSIIDDQNKYYYSDNIYGHENKEGVSQDVLPAGKYFIRIAPKEYSNVEYAFMVYETE